MRRYLNCFIEKAICQFGRLRSPSGEDLLQMGLVEGDCHRPAVGAALRALASEQLIDQALHLT
jgi:hypothetical protein